MSAAKKQHQKQTAAALRLEKAPYSDQTHGVTAEIVVEVSEPLALTLAVDVESRERSIATKDGINGLLYHPDWQLVRGDGSLPHHDEPLPVHLEDLEAFGRAVLRLAAEVQRLGILPPSKEA